MKEKLKQNEKTWDMVADQFFDASALPEWGPFGVGTDTHLIPEIKDKAFLEIGCGSGRSIKYLMDNGAAKVYGLDISKVQLEESARFNQDVVDQGKITLIHTPMEQRIEIAPVDVAVSVYALGWTQDPEATLANIHSYLKTGGLFIWSWEHAIFSDVMYQNGQFIVEHNYHEENHLALENWNKSGMVACLTYRKISTWFKLLTGAGFEVVGYYEPQPMNMRRGFEEPDRYYSIQKARKVPATFIFVCKKK